MMRRLMNILMLSCKRATALIEKKKLARLSKKEQLQLKMHMSMCKACNSYSDQSDIMDKSLESYWSENNAKEKNTLSESSKQKIIDTINKS
tara:strand:- start:2658 stop:2930 length:273 start_codon:yes stop_codon:yes gene_type:complete